MLKKTKSKHKWTMLGIKMMRKLENILECTNFAENKSVTDEKFY